MLLVAAITLGMFVTSTSARGGTVPPNLNGEALFTGNPGFLNVSQVCSTTGDSTVNFNASGDVAAGPYPGTFTEQGTAVISQPDPNNLQPASFLVGLTPYGTVVSLHATFTIASGTTTITGSKNLTVPRLALCAQFTGEGEYAGQPTGQSIFKNIEFSGTTDFAAVIHTEAGSFSDSGSTDIDFFQLGFEPGTLPFTVGAGGFSQRFSTATPVVPLGPDSVVLTPGAAVNNVGTSHTVTATATGAGHPSEGSTILFNVSGSVSSNGSCITNSTGQCTFTYSGPLLPGADVITACADNNHNGVADTGEPCGQATKAWTLPTSTPGQVTGGGQLPSGGSGQIAFGFNAHDTKQGVKGECTVVDTTGTDTKVKCTDATVLVQSATQATFFGNATVNGAATTYRIDVTDNGEPGTGHDTFSIHTASGYSATGTIAAGNIQVH